MRKFALTRAACDRAKHWPRLHRALREALSSDPQLTQPLELA
jgi:hypothetical protein